MPQTSGPQSPILGSIFSRRAQDPLYMELASAPAVERDSSELDMDEEQDVVDEREKSPTAPQIILTPSTPTHEYPSHTRSLSQSLIENTHAFFADYAFQRGGQPIILHSPTPSEDGDSDSDADADEFSFTQKSKRFVGLKRRRGIGGKRTASCSANEILPRLTRYAIFVAIIALIVLLHVVVLRRIAASDS